MDFGQMRLHGEPAHFRHVQIENNAIRQVRFDESQKFRTGAECLYVQAAGIHQPGKGFADGLFVVYDGDQWMSFGHSGPTVAGRGEARYWTLVQYGDATEPALSEAG